MNKREQAWAVLLCALTDLGGEASKQDVLAYIQEQGFWYRNDTNSPSPPSRASEFQWRNEISYARQHMVERGCIANRRRDWWEITNSGRLFFRDLTEMVIETVTFDGVRFTPSFYDHICYIYELEAPSEGSADRLLAEQVSSEAYDDAEPIRLVDEPMPKGPGLKGRGNRTYYRRSPSVSKRALRLAGYRCEIDKAHISFMCRDLSHQYMEPHHLIPMQMTDDFDVSLDREQNIVCLCSTCHNQIHYGAAQDVRKMLEILFSARKESLAAILGQAVTLEDIYRMYNVL